jgi:hypothetical protein
MKARDGATAADRAETNWMAWTAGAFAVLTLALSISRFLDADEIEHLHSTWHVLGGALPYVDFFQHHHSLLWCCLAPVLALTGESASAVIVFRVLFFLLTLAIVRAAYQLAIECRPSRGAAWLAAVLLLSLTTFVYAAIEVRPDVPQTLLGVLSARHLIRTLRTGARRDAVLAGVFAALAFAFLQKAAFVLVFFPLVFAAHAARGRAPWRTGVWIAAAFVVSILPFFAYLAASGSLHDYLLGNWQLGVRIPAGRAEYSYLDPVVLRDFARNGVFWALALAMGATLAARRLRADYAVPAVIGLGTVAVLFALNRVVDRYLIAAMPFLAVATALWLSDQLAARNVRRGRFAAVLLAIILVPAVAMVRATGRSNRGQLAEIQYVLDRSQSGDRMYDAQRQFNVFRPDMHYFWFMDGTGARIYSGLTGGRFSDYDACRLIASVGPRFVSDRRGVLEACGVAGLYRPTAFGRLFERNGT